MVNTYQAQRTWDKGKTRFPNIRGEEDDYLQNLFCLEQQIGYMAVKQAALSDEDVALALAVCGVSILAITDRREPPEFSGLAPEVAELVNRCMATFHPAYNPRGAEAAALLWRDPADEEFHYTTVGSLLRRLSDSCRHWTRAGGRKGYVTWVVAFLREANGMPQDDGDIDFVIGSRHAPDDFEETSKKEG